MNKPKTSNESHDRLQIDEYDCLIVEKWPPVRVLVTESARELPPWCFQLCEPALHSP